MTQNQIDQLAARKLRGRELSDALDHLENCEHCRQCVNLPSTEEILARFIIEPEEDTITGTTEEGRETDDFREPPGESEGENDFDDFLKRIRDRRKNS